MRRTATNSSQQCRIGLILMTQRNVLMRRAAGQCQDVYIVVIFGTGGVAAKDLVELLELELEPSKQASGRLRANGRAWPLFSRQSHLPGTG